MTEQIKAYICKLFDKYGGGCGYQVDGCTLFYAENEKKIIFFACQLKKVLYLQSEKHKNC